MVLGTIIILVNVRSEHIGKAERERKREGGRRREREGEGEEEERERERQRERERERASAGSKSYLSAIDKIDFIRDVIAYMCAVALVIGIAYDGDVSCNHYTLVS